MQEPLPALRPNWPLHIALFVATVASTMLTYALMSRSWRDGALYSAGVLGILLAHELGHYLTARRYRVPATPPYFLPLPLLSPFGTMGAVIRMATLGADRRVLFDIAAAGPVAGMVVALPVSLVGLALSRVVDAADVGADMRTLGTSLLFQWCSDVVVGRLPDGQDIVLHPLAYAGWAGFFVTSFNLFPVGQFDGGHVSYALFGRRSRWLALAVAAGLVGLTAFVNIAWLFAAVIVVLFGLRHPPTGDDTVPIGRGRTILGVLLLLLFVLTFTPRPFN
jgi:membrane-associated protease RseP (regulator of RpoE activity)